VDFPTVHRLWNATTDLHLSELYRLADAIEVPAAELICDMEVHQLLILRGLLLRIAKITNASIQMPPADWRECPAMVGSIKALIDEELLGASQ
jgi:hypothetical protein